jgi:hypothetical protein
VEAASRSGSSAKARRWHRIAAAILTAAAIIAQTCAADAQSGDATITYHGVEFPAALAGGERIGTRDYEPTNPGLGFSAGYRHRGATSTVYIYDAGVRSIPDDIRTPIVVQQLEQAKSDIRLRAEREGAVVKRMSAFEIVDASGQPRLTCEGFDLRRADKAVPTDTYVCVGVAKGKFFKMRTSMRQRRDSEAEVRRFADAWAAKLWRP